MILSEFRYDSMEVYNPQTCFQHPDREAVVRCPSCRKYYCRECVTEHDDRMLCSNCLAALTAPHQTDAKVRFFHLKLLLQGGGGLSRVVVSFFPCGADAAIHSPFISRRHLLAERLVEVTMTVKTDADVPGGMALAEQAVHLLRAKGGVALGCYYVGCLPFLLGLLYFWSDMSRNPDAGWYCAPAAAGMTLLFIWMKVWQVCFCRRLWCALQDTAPESWNWRRWLAVAARQTFYHGTGILVLFLAAVIMLPLAWTYAFYQNVTIMDSPTTRSMKTLYADASRQALLWPGQNHILLTLMSLFGLLVWMNTGAGLMLLPYLLKWFLGVETAFTISGLHAMTNTTFLAIICALVYAFVDPVAKAAYTLRCFYGRSRHTGDDLRAALKPFIMGLSVGLAILAGAVAISPVRPVYGDNRVNASMVAGQEDFVHRLDKRIDQTLSQRRFAWRLSPGKGADGRSGASRMALGYPSLAGR